MSKVKVCLSVKTWRHQVGDEVSVDSEVADDMVANRKATFVSTKKQAEAQPDA